MGYSIKNCVRGSAIPGQWIKDVKNNVCGLDILLVGDSNCHYGEGNPDNNIGNGNRIFGLADGLARTLIDEGLNLYASPLYPIGIGANVFKTGLGSWLYSVANRDADPSVGTGSIRLRNTAGTATAGYLGTTYNFANAAFSGLPDDFTFFYNQMSQNKLADAASLQASAKPGFYSHDPSGSTPLGTNWYLFTASSQVRADQLVLDGDNVNAVWTSPAKWDNSVIYFRMTHSSTPNGGSITLGITRDGGGGTTGAGSSNLTFATKNLNETGYKFKDSELAINTIAGMPTSANLVKSEGVRIYFTGATGSLSVVTAPIAGFFVSVYEKKLGFSVSSLQCEGQSLPEDHFNKFKEVNDAGNYLGQFFNALIRRQLAASTKNKGRVLIIFQAGTNTNVNYNGGLASTNSTAATARVRQSFENSINLLRKKWTDLGYDAGNLAFIVLGGPVTSNTFSDDISAKLFQTEGAVDVCCVDHVLALPRSEYTSGSLWDGGDIVGTGSSTAATHLAEPGYTEWGTAIVKNLLQYSNKTHKAKKG